MFLVVFRNRKRADLDAAAYAEAAARMEALARAQPGFLAFQSYVAQDGEVVAISEWASAEAARAWGAEPEHRRTQSRRAEFYAAYTLFTCDDPKVRSFTNPDRDAS